MPPGQNDQGTVQLGDVAIFVAAVDPTLEREPLFAVVQIAVLGGLAGMFLSLLPITRFLNINR